MTRAQAFSIRANGVVKGGDASYSADTLSGRIEYQGKVSVGFWPFTKTIPTKGSYQVDPSLLLSSRFQKPGDSVTLGSVTFTATDVKPGTTMVAVSVAGTSMKGTAIVDTEAQFIRIAKMVATVVSILGTLTIEAVAISGGKRK